MKRFLVVLLCITCGCGYTTRAYVNRGDIYVKPVLNQINTTSETRAYSGYTSFPVFIEKKLTNVLLSDFSTKGAYSPVSSEENAFSLECRIYDYKKEALRYSDSDDVTEQRLRLYVHTTLFDPAGTVSIEKDVVGETTYFLSGQYAVSESQALSDLVDDTSRRIVDAVSENW